MLRFALLVLLAASAAHAKVFSSCELAQTLVRLGSPRDQVPTWVCIAYHESSYNTAAVGRLNTDGSADHGIFQINDRYWCYPGTGCASACSAFENDDISDDFRCVRSIYSQTESYGQPGFSAWTTYYPYCANGQANSYVSGCSY